MRSDDPEEDDDHEPDPLLSPEHRRALHDVDHRPDQERKLDEGEQDERDDDAGRQPVDRARQQVHLVFSLIVWIGRRHGCRESRPRRRAGCGLKPSAASLRESSRPMAPRTRSTLRIRPRRTMPGPVRECYGRSAHFRAPRPGSPRREPSQPWRSSCTRLAASSSPTPCSPRSWSRWASATWPPPGVPSRRRSSSRRWSRHRRRRRRRARRRPRRRRRSSSTPAAPCPTPESTSCPPGPASPTSWLSPPPIAKADLASINLAARLTDGQQVVVPLKGAVAQAAPARRCRHRGGGRRRRVERTQ